MASLSSPPHAGGTIMNPLSSPSATSPSAAGPQGATTSASFPFSNPSGSIPLNNVYHHHHPPRRLLIFHETRNPQNTAESVYIAVNAQGLPICGPGPELFQTSVLDLPLRIIKAFTDIFNTPRYKNWAIVGAGPYHDLSEDGKFYAVVLEQVREQQGQQIAK